jgi:hypothetical protein
MAWTAPRTWTAGEVVTAAILNTHVRDNLKAATEWTSYAPTWTATGGTPTLGNGTLSGRYRKAGNLCHLTITLTIGSTTGLVGSNWLFSVPAGCTAVTGLLFWVASDYGTTVYSGVSQFSGANTPWLFRDGSASGVGATVPFTWAANDSLTLSSVYEI